MKNRDFVAIAIFSALFIASNLLPSFVIPYVLVPITLQTIVVSLAGALLGSKRGFLAIFFVILLSAIGFPILSQGKGGLLIFFSPTTGYLLSFPLSAYLTGKIYEKYNLKSFFSQCFFLFFTMIVVVHICGNLWLSFYFHQDLVKILKGTFIFVLTDFVKLVLTILILNSLRSVHSKLF